MPYSRDMVALGEGGVRWGKEGRGRARYGILWWDINGYMVCATF